MTTTNYRTEVIPTHDTETIIELTDEAVDDFGRRQFTVHWLGDGPRAVGFDFGHRAQVFYTQVETVTDRHAARGRTVRVVGPFPAPTKTRRLA